MRPRRSLPSSPASARALVLMRLVRSVWPGRWPLGGFGKVEGRQRLLTLHEVLNPFAGSEKARGQLWCERQQAADECEIFARFVDGACFAPGPLELAQVLRELSLWLWGWQALGFFFCLEQGLIAVPEARHGQPRRGQAGSGAAASLALGEERPYSPA